MPSTPSEIEAMVAEWTRLEAAFHDALPSAQGEPGDRGVAGRALCQWLYDNSGVLREALARTAQAPAIGREDLKAVIGTKRRDWISSHGTKGMGIDDAIADAILAAFPQIATPDEARAGMFREESDG